MRDPSWAKRGWAGHRGFLLSSFSLSGLSARRQAERFGRGGTQRDLSSGRTGAGASLPFLRWLRTLGRVVVGGSPFGGFGGSALGAWGFWPFSLSARPFSLLFGRKARSIRRRFGCSSANYRRLNGVALVALSSQSSPFRRLLRPGAFPSSYTRVRAWPPSSPLRRAKVGPAPELRPFAVEKSTWPPGFPLRHAKAHQPSRLSHFAVEKFTASPLKSPPDHPVFHFAVEKSARPPGFSLRRAKIHSSARFSTSSQRTSAVCSGEAPKGGSDLRGPS